MSDDSVDARPLTSVELLDAVTVLCKARGYIARQEVEWRR